MAVTIRAITSNDFLDTLKCFQCGKEVVNLTISGGEYCGECGNEIDLCRSCARGLAAEILEAAQEPTSYVEAYFTAKWDVEGKK